MCSACLEDLRERQRHDGPVRIPRGLPPPQPQRPALPQGPAPQQPALEDAATAAALARYRRRAWAMLLTGLALLVGFLVAVNIVETRADDLLLGGATAPGVVRSVQGGRMVVSFHADGQARQAIVHLDSRSPDYQVGQAVTVVYDPDDPDRVRTPADTNQSPLTVIPMSLALPSGVVLTVMGSVARVRAARIRRVLACHPWQAWLYQLQTARIGVAWCWMAVYGRPTPTGGPFMLLGFLMTPVWRLQCWLRNPYGTAWFAGDTGLVVVARPDVEQVFAARTPRTAWTRRRWARTLPQPVPVPAPHPAPADPGLDAEPMDITPELCWRCDAAPATSNLGTCDACLTDLRGRGG